MKNYPIQARREIEFTFCLVTLADTPAFVCSISHYAITCRLTAMQTNSNYFQRSQLITTKHTQSPSFHLISLPSDGRQTELTFICF